MSSFAPGGSLFDPVALLSQIEFAHVIKSILARQAMRKLSALHHFLQDLCIFAFQAIPFFPHQPDDSVNMRRGKQKPTLQNLRYMEVT